MNTLSSLKVTLLLGAAVTTLNLAAVAGPGPQDFPHRLQSRAEAEKVEAGTKVALACKDCKNLDVKTADEKRSFLNWFKPDEKHDCGGCGGKMTVKTPGSGKAGSTAEYTHVCTKCGDDSAYTCAAHKGAKS